MQPRDTYTHGHAESVLRSHSNRTVENSAAYLAPYLARGRDVLDVGCGPGTITRDFVRFVTPGRVVGVDEAGSVVEKAASSGPSDGVEFAVGDAYALAFPDASFDVVHAHQVLQHLSDPVAALREWKRLCRPGGVVAARDADYAAFTWFPDDPKLDRWLALYRSAAYANRAQPDAGRRLLAWAHAAGFTDVVATASVWCYATPHDREFWGGMWAERIVGSALTTQLLEAGVDQRELDEISAAWRQWAAHPDAWFMVPHGEIVCRAPDR
ncbi:MAG: methyltransferase domain-containing protein [Acidimicrobiia bacterium]